MGVSTGCGCKEIYRFTHSTYPYFSCICSFLQQHPNYFVHKELAALACDAVAPHLKKTDIEGGKEYLLSNNDEVDGIVQL